MDNSAISGMASLATPAASFQTNDGAGISVLKKALDTQAMAAAALIQTIAESPQPTAPSDNPGSNIDVSA